MPFTKEDDRKIAEKPVSSSDAQSVVTVETVAEPKPKPETEALPSPSDRAKYETESDEESDKKHNRNFPTQKNQSQKNATDHLMNGLKEEEK